MLLPLPGSIAYSQLLNHPELGPRYRGQDIFDLEQAKKDWLNNFTHANYKLLSEAINELLSQASCNYGVAALKKY